MMFQQRLVPYSGALIVDFEHILISFPVGRYLFSVNNKDARATSENIVLKSLLLSLSKYLPSDLKIVFRQRLYYEICIFSKKAKSKKLIQKISIHTT